MRPWGWSIIILIGTALGYAGLLVGAFAVTGSPVLATAVTNGLTLVLVFAVRVMTRGKGPLGTSGRAQQEQLSPAFILAGTAALVACWITGQMFAAALLPDGSRGFDHRSAVQDRAPVLLLLVSLVLLSPAGEEALMRGVVYPVLRRHMPAWVTAVTSTAAFSLLHLNLLQVLVTLPLGMLLAFVYERTCRLWPVVLMHIGFNAASVVGDRSWFSGWVSLPAACAGLVVVATLLWLLRPAGLGSSRGDGGVFSS